MEKYIYANFNLNLSLLDFQGDITKLLDLTNIEEWDGEVIKEREEKIRQAALVLAGQCIARLFYNLSQSELGNQTAITQTKGWWHPKTQKHDYRKREILTIGNVLMTLKLLSVVKRTEKIKEKNKSRNQGFYPFLKWLGMSEGLTPLVWSTIAQYGALFLFV